MNNLDQRFYGGIRIKAVVINTKKQFAWKLQVFITDTTKKSIEWKMMHETLYFQAYSSLLTVKYNNRIFVYATAYWEGSLPIEQPFEIIQGLPV